MVSTRLEDLRQALRDTYDDDTLINSVALGGTTEGTSRNYESGWKLWKRAASELGFKIYPITAEQLAKALVWAISGDQTGTEAMRSSVSNFQAIIDKTDDKKKWIGGALVVTRVVEHLRPNSRKCRYLSIWDADILISSVIKSGPRTAAREILHTFMEERGKSILSIFSDDSETRVLQTALLKLKSEQLQELQQSFAVLLLILTMRRFQDVCNIWMDSVEVDDNKVSLLFSHTKTEKRTLITVPRLSAGFDFGEDFVVHWAIMRDLRQVSDCRLLCSRRMGLLQLRANTISAYMKKSMQTAGIDTEKYSPYSFRCAMATYLGNKGMTEADIMALGGWRSTETFKNFYSRMTRPRREMVELIAGTNSIESFVEEFPLVEEDD
jgi:hypothetical protein